MARTRLSVALALSVSALLAVACSGKGGGGAPKGKIEGAAANAVSVLPKDAIFVFGVNADKVRETKLWAEYGPKLMQGEAKEVIDLVKSTCNIDLVKDVTGLVFAGSDFAAQDKVVFIIKGKFDEDKANKCIADIAKAKEGKAVTTKKEGKLTVYTAEGESDALYAAWLAKDTIMMTSNPTSKDYLASLVDAKETIKNNADLWDLVQKCDTTSTLWGAMVIPAGGMPGVPLPMGKDTPKAFYTSINFTKSLNASIGLRFESDKVAKEMGDQAGKELEAQKKEEMAGKFLKGVSVKTAGKDVVVTASLGEKEVDELVQMATAMLPMLMGGFGGM